ncbi:MAG: alpha/beta fold hydrolase [Ktedonobacterales bacterium]
MPTALLPAPVSRVVSLPSGRTLGIAEQGDPAGVPILFFHGFVGSRLQCPPSGAMLGALGIHLIAVDRPGIGLSDPIAHRRLLDWANDITGLAEVLQLPQFAILGWSAGAPHAMVCASRLPKQVVALGLASPMGGWFIGPGATRHISKESRGITTLVRYAPWALKPSFTLVKWRMRHDPKGLVEDQLRQLPSIDQATLADPLLRRMLIDTAGEAFRLGVRGVYEDTLVVARPWGFAPETISTPTWIWQGNADTTVLPALADELAEKLANCRATSFSGEGHFVVFTHWQAIMRTLALAFREVSAP